MRVTLTLPQQIPLPTMMKKVTTLNTYPIEALNIAIRASPGADNIWQAIFTPLFREYETMNDLAKRLTSKNSHRNI